MYGHLLNSIREQQSFKIDVYPKSLPDAYEMLSAHTNHSNNTSKNKRESKSAGGNNDATAIKNNNKDDGQGGQTDTSYLQTEIIPGTDGRTIAHITYYNCGKKGHYADNCPAEEQGQNNEEQHVHVTDEHDNELHDGGDQMLQFEDNDDDIIHFSWTQVHYANSARYLDTDILLDTGSTFSVFKNKDMLLNIRDGDQTLKAYTNGGRQDSNLVADIPGFLYSLVQPSINDQYTFLG